MGVRHCSAINCQNNSKKCTQMHFFRFPKDEQRCKKWIQNSRRNDLLRKPASYCYNNLLLCEQHFEDSMFYNAQLKISLIKTAIPTLFDVPNPPKKETLKRSLPERKGKKAAPTKKISPQDTKIMLTKKYIAQRKGKAGRKSFYGKSKEVLILRRALEAKKQAVRVMRKKEERERNKSKPEEIIKEASLYLSWNELEVLKYQLSRRKRSSNAFKILALSLSYKSSSCYKMLSKKLRFPHPRTLSRWISHYKIREGFDTQLLNSLRQKVQLLSEENRVCALLIDEMGLKLHSQYDKIGDEIVGIRLEKEKIIFPSTATVFMVSGIREKWRQAVGYFFTSKGMRGNELKEKISKCIELLQANGLTVIAITSDQGSNFCSAVSAFHVTEKKPYFCINEQKVFVINDPPHLWKSIHNCLLTDNIVIEEGTVSWSFIEEMYNIDKSKMLRLCPKLTPDHIWPPKFGGKMKVKLATQVFSHSVSSGIKSYIALNELSKSAAVTGLFCERVNSLIDIMNSSTQFGSTVFKNGLCIGSESFSEIEKLIQWISTWKIINRKGQIRNNQFRFLKGLLLTLNSMQQVCVHLNGPFKFIMMRRLCQDPLEHFFSIIRQKGGYNYNPTCIGFRQAFRLANLN